MTLTLLLLAGAAPPARTATRLRLQSVPIPSAVPRGITVGPDGNIWFAGDTGPFYGKPQLLGGYIGRVDRSGHVKVFPTPVAGSGPERIISGGDGALWFTERDGNRIGRITTAGKITEFPVPVPDARPRGITRGPGGNFWITLYGAGGVARMTPSGAFTVFTPGGQPLGIATGSDNAIWFTEPRGDRIARITSAGALRDYPVSNASGPESIAKGPGGDLWFTEDDGDRVGRITTSGKLREWPVTPGSNPSGITAGRDGAMWFTELEGQRVGRVTPGGVVTEYDLPAGSFPYEIVAGPKGRMWVTLGYAVKLASFVPPLAPVVSATLPYRYTAVGGGFRFSTLRATGVPSNGRVELTCRGGGCNVRVRSEGRSTVDLRKRLPRTIRPGMKIAVRVSAPGLTTFVRSFTAGSRDLTSRDRCQAPRSTKLQRCPSP